MNIQERVRDFKTKHKEGFVSSEIEELLKDFPSINMKKFNSALNHITAISIEGEIVIYHQDVEVALLCGIENRDLTDEEFD